MKGLKECVSDYQMLRLPEEPNSIHKATPRLVFDLWNEVRKLRKEINDLRKEEPDIVYVAIAYELGYLNGNSYLVYATADLGLCMQNAIAENHRREAEYAVAIYAVEDEIERPCYYVSSKRSEFELSYNKTIDLAEQIGAKVLGAVQTDKPIPDWLMDEIMSREEE